MKSENIPVCALLYATIRRWAGKIASQFVPFVSVRRKFVSPYDLPAKTSYLDRA